MNTGDDTQGNRLEKVGNFIKEECALFLARENNHASLISITHVSVSPDLKRATVFVTVLPDSKEELAINFIKRRLGDFRQSLKGRMTTKSVPFLEVALDLGEKNRQKIDELLRNG